MSNRLDWERDGRDWPNHAASRFVPAAGLRWHVQQAGNGPVILLIHGTGSKIDAIGMTLYGRLIRNSEHAAAALGMMANWDLQPIQRELPMLKVPLTLVVGQNDRTVPPSESERIKRLLPSAKRLSLPGLGHLAHEERPKEILTLIRNLMLN